MPGNTKPVFSEVCVRVTVMDGPFGAYVDGADVACALDEGAIRTLVGALYSHRILLLRGQNPDRAAYLRFGQEWGTPLSFFVPAHRDEEFPEIIRIENPAKTPENRRDGAMHWHQDSSYEREAAQVTMVHAVEAPAGRNDTLFVDMVAAWEALPAEMQRRLDGLRVVHDPNGGKVAFAGEVRGKGEHEPLPLVDHPLVLAHPVVGRKALYGISGTACGVVGMPDDEAIELLKDLKRHALQDRFRQTARAETGSILIWDNASVMHSATRTAYSDEPGERRLLHRISTVGRPRLAGELVV